MCTGCLFCGGNASERDHHTRCDDMRAMHRRLVLHEIRAAGVHGCTDDELQQRLDLDDSAERPRRWELWKLHAIDMRRDEHHEPVRRLTRTHRRAVVWVATPGRPPSL